MHAHLCRTNPTPSRRLLAVLGLALLCTTAQAQKLFTRIAPKASGIDFVNQLEDTREHNILIYSNYYGGAGVGLGDIDNDGLPDLFFAGNLVPDRLYLNKGNLQFEDITASAGILDDGTWSTSVVMADVNNDGWLDIYVCRELYDDRPDLRRNALYINNGDRTFAERAAEYGLADTARTRHASFLDYDRDGDLDLFLLNQPPNPGNYSPLKGEDLTRERYRPRLYRNDGTRFTDVSRQAGVLEPGFGNSLVCADFDRDGWTDVYIANDFDQPDRFYRNNHDGTFTNIIDEAMGHISYYSMGVDAADIDNDGWTDLMVLDMVAEDNFRLKANMSGMNPDAFWKVVSQGGHYQYMFNTLQRNQGHLHFSDIAQLAGVATTDWSWANLIADFDNDGWKDIFVTNGLLRDIRNSDAAKTFPKYITQAINNYILANPNNPDITIWDVIDLDQALALLPSVPLTNYAFRNNGDLTFAKVMDEWGLDVQTFSNGAAYGDLDGDGDLDLVVSNVNEAAHIYRNNSRQQPGGNYLRVALQSARPVLGARAEIRVGDQWQYAELVNVRGIYSTSEQVLHFGMGSAATIDYLRVIWPDGRETLREQVAANQTLRLDDTQAAEALPHVGAVLPRFGDQTEGSGIDYRHRENAHDDYAAEVLLPHQMSRFGPALAVADVDGDGWEDFFVGGAVGSAGALYRQRSDGQFVADADGPWAAHADAEDVAATFFDADADGDPDLYVASGGNEYPAGDARYRDRLYLNEGGRFVWAETALPTLAVSSAGAWPCDWDGDGDLDLLVGGRQVPKAYPRPADSYLLRNEGLREGLPRFADVTAELAPALRGLGMVSDAVWTDFDGDGLVDMLLVGEWMPVTVLRQVAGKWEDATRSLGLGDKTGWWFSVAAADMDGDGDDDYVLGNLGLNYKYHASSGKPFHVYYDDFDANGSYDIVLGFYQESELYPLRGRSCSSQQVPSLAQKFPTYNQFASATLTEVYGSLPLKRSLNYQARTFASAYIENQGGGRFGWRDLPVEAQLAPVRDLLLEDIDGDGLRDIVLAGNLYVSEIETARADAGMGLWLRGAGAGTFAPVRAHTSGLYLPCDLRYLVPVHTPQGLALLAGVNDGPLRLIGVRGTVR
ncbi:MAG: VCBS repeat-containing protein [Bacteroidia bacterium]